jgi:hypothetical protein
MRHREGRIGLPIREAPQHRHPPRRMAGIVCEGREAKLSVFGSSNLPVPTIRILLLPGSLPKA